MNAKLSQSHTDGIIPAQKKFALGISKNIGVTLKLFQIGAQLKELKFGVIPSAMKANTKTRQWLNKI